MILLFLFFSCEKVELQPLNIFNQTTYSESFFENFFQLLGQCSLENTYDKLESFLRNTLKNTYKEINISELMLEETSIKSFVLSLKKEIFVLDNTFYQHYMFVKKLFKDTLNFSSLWLYTKKFYEARKRVLSFQEYFIFILLESLNIENNTISIKESYLYYYHKFHTKLKLLYYSVYSDFDLPGVFFTSGIFNEKSVFFEEKKLRLIYNFIQNLENEFQQPLIYREACKKILLKALSEKNINNFYYVLINSFKNYEPYLSLEFFPFFQNLKL